MGIIKTEQLDNAIDHYLIKLFRFGLELARNQGECVESFQMYVTLISF